jgi:hypothetical protein
MVGTYYSTPDLLAPADLQNFKRGVESQLAALTTELNGVISRLNYCEPLMYKGMEFMEWMEKAHPDIINAYKAQKEVSETLDRANGEFTIVAGVKL